MEAELEACQIAAQEGRLVRVRTADRPRSNARAIWEEAHGPVPEGFDVDHLIQRQHGATVLHPDYEQWIESGPAQLFNEKIKDLCGLQEHPRRGGRA